MSHKILSKNRLLMGAATAAMATLMATAPAHAIVPNENKTPAEAENPNAGPNGDGINGVGQLYVTQGFTCTGTLVNPRTVIFAAHCVNDYAQNTFGGNGEQFMVAFDQYAFPSLLASLQRGWVSIPELNVFRANQVVFHPHSVDGGGGFFEADVAIATLDTPASNIPTWAMLFSPLPAPGEITAETGTGYHVNISGYGQTGNITQGTLVSGAWRRRAADNYLGVLGSNKQFDLLRKSVFDAFGIAFTPTTYDQNVYIIDFDNPNNPLAGNNYTLDQATEDEGITGRGDSGSALFLDAANNDITDQDLILGVLSGGFSSDRYGTSSFFQPLYAYWDWIVENNPYHYVTAKSGDGNWEDASHWESMIDPNYKVLDENNNVVNGVPTHLGAEEETTGGRFGSFCFRFLGSGVNECMDAGTDEIYTYEDRYPEEGDEAEGGEDANDNRGTGTVESKPDAAVIASSPDAVNITDGSETAVIAQAEAQSSETTGNVATKEATGELANAATMTLAAHDGNVEGAEKITYVPHADGDEATDGAEEEETALIYSEEPVGDPTLDNGLPGATGFVPNNQDHAVDEDNVTTQNSEYYDVTLGNAGTTTLSSAVVIDNLTVTNLAKLDIAETGDLTSLIEVNQTGGNVHVDGNLRSVGDYTLVTGILSGEGTVTAPFVTNIAGVISPGEPDTIGKLTIDGSLIMASEAIYNVTVGLNNTSDLLYVTENVALGGTVLPSLANGFRYTEGAVYRIFEADGFVFELGDDDELTTELTTGFDSVAPISAIIYGTLETGKEDIAVPAENEGDEATSFERTFVNLRINFRDYYDVIGGNSLVQSAYARLMDRNDRTGALAELYNQLDYMSAAEIADTFERLAPFTESTVRNTAKAATLQANRFYRTRMNNVLNGDYGGTVATLGTPMQMAANATNGYNAAPMAAAAANSATTVQDNGSMNSDWAAYLAGGYLDGSGKGMPAALSNNRDHFDGYFITGGLEYLGKDNTVIGLSVYYSDVDGNAALNQSADAKLWQGTLYGAYQSDSMGLVFDGLISAGNYKAKTRRDVTIGANAYNLRSSDNSFAFVAEGGVSYPIEVYGGAYITPRAALNYTTVDFSDVNETGGAAGLQIERDRYESLQGRIGMSFSGKKDARVKPYFYADFVYDYLDHDDRFGANWVGSTAQVAPFQLSNYDSSWGEMGLGITYNGDAFDITAAVDTTVGSQDVRSQSYSLTARFQF